MRTIAAWEGPGRLPGQVDRRDQVVRTLTLPNPGIAFLEITSG